MTHPHHPAKQRTQREGQDHSEQDLGMPPTPPPEGVTMTDAWERMLPLLNEYAAHVTDAAMHQAASRADLSRSAALKTLGKLRETFVLHCREVAETERHACSIAVWMTKMDATEEGADDLGVRGWLHEAEQRVKNRGREDRTAAALPGDAGGGR